MDKCMREISHNFTLFCENTQKKHCISVHLCFHLAIHSTHIISGPLHSINTGSALWFRWYGGARNEPRYVCDTLTVTSDDDIWLQVQDLHSLYAIPTSGFNKIEDCRNRKQDWERNIV